jgi:tetratricopeptide (TPR) repeat protein
MSMPTSHSTATESALTALWLPRSLLVTIQTFSFKELAPSHIARPIPTVAALFLICLSAGTVSARAQNVTAAELKRAQQDCLGRGLKARIAGCTKIIATVDDRRLSYAYFNRGVAYRLIGHIDRAVADFDATIRLKPNFALAFNERGIAFRAKRQYDRAIQDYTQAIRLDPKLVWPLNNRGNVYRDKGQYDRAIRDYEAAIRLNPKYAAAYHNRGLAFGLKGALDREIEDYDAAIRVAAEFPAAYIDRGDAYREKGQYDRAIRDYDQAIRINPRFPLAYNGRGLAYAAKGEYEWAIADFNRALRLAPKFGAPLYNRALAYVARGKLARARVDYRQAMLRDINFSMAFSTGSRLVRAFKTKERRVIADQDRAIQLDPNNALARFNRGNKRLLGATIFHRYDHAIEEYTQAIRLEPTFAGAFHNRGKAFYRKGERDRAIADYSVAIRLDPARAVVYYDRAFALGRNREHQRALKDYTAAVRFDPKLADAHNGIAWSLLKLGQPEPALAEINKALALENTAGSRDTRAHILQALGKASEARAEYEAAMRTGGASYVWLYQRGLREAGLYKGVMSGRPGEDLFAALSSCAGDPRCDPVPKDRR